MPLPGDGAGSVTLAILPGKETMSVDESRMPPSTVAALREQLVYSLSGKGAHMSFDQAVKEIGRASCRARV